MPVFRLCALLLVLSAAPAVAQSARPWAPVEAFSELCLAGDLDAALAQAESRGDAEIDPIVITSHDGASHALMWRGTMVQLVERAVIGGEACSVIIPTSVRPRALSQLERLLGPYEVSADGTAEWRLPEGRYVWAHERRGQLWITHF